MRLQVVLFALNVSCSLILIQLYRCLYKANVFGIESVFEFLQPYENMNSSLARYLMAV